MRTLIDLLHILMKQDVRLIPNEAYETCQAAYDGILSTMRVVRGNEKLGCVISWLVSNSFT